MDFRVTITERDVAFLTLAKDHYKVLVKVSERQCDERTTGIFRKQEFYAERFLERVVQQIEEAPNAD